MNPYWAGLVGAIASSLIGQTLLKAGSGAPDFIHQLFDWRTLLGLMFYGGAAMLYIVALRRIPMSTALPFTAVSYIVGAMVGHFAFHEPISATQLGALVLIGCGVALLAFG